MPTFGTNDIPQSQRGGYDDIRAVEIGVQLHTVLGKCHSQCKEVIIVSKEQLLVGE